MEILIKACSGAGGRGSFQIGTAGHEVCIQRPEILQTRRIQEKGGCDARLLKNPKQELLFLILRFPLFIFVVGIFSLTSFPFILYQGDMLSQIC